MGIQQIEITIYNSTKALFYWIKKYIASYKYDRYDIEMHPQILVKLK